MIILGLFAPVLCVAVPMLAVMIVMVIYIVAYYCISLPLSRHSQQEEGTSGMMLNMVSSEETAEEMNNTEGK